MFLNRSSGVTANPACPDGYPIGARAELDESGSAWYPKKWSSFFDTCRNVALGGRVAEVSAKVYAVWQVPGWVVFSLSFVLIIAGLAFGGATTLIGFGGLLGASFHRALGTPLPLPTIHNPFERRLYIYVGIGGLVVWVSAFLYSLKIAP